MHQPPVLTSVSSDRTRLRRRVIALAIVLLAIGLALVVSIYESRESECVYNCESNLVPE
jgi:NADH:ubiquinone oxidoreductase subunit K